MSTMMGDMVGRAALTSAVGMGSNEQVEVLALANSLAIWIASTGGEGSEVGCDEGCGRSGDTRGLGFV